MTVYFSIFSLLIISDRESIVSFPREQKGEILSSLRILQGKMLADS